MHRSASVASILLVFALAAYMPAYAHSRTLLVGGLERTYRVYRPTDLSRVRPLPLVIVMHGGFGSGRQAERAYHWDAQANQHGFIVVYPNGVRRSWNAGGICCGPAQRDGVNDVKFKAQLIDTVIRSENIDQKRVYLTGMSNGAAMAYRYGCEGSFPVAAIGSVSGSFSFVCARPHAVSVIEIHGVDDNNIPFDGGHGSKAATQVHWLPVGRRLISSAEPISVNRHPPARAI
jgi:polyhydroxybutyrate depolymerase